MKYTDRLRIRLARPQGMRQDFDPYQKMKVSRDEFPEETRPPKGLKDGRCNVTACQVPGATFFNKSTRAYYCRYCASEINYVGGRALTMEIYGVPMLCEHYDSPTAYRNGGWRREQG